MKNEIEKLKEELDITVKGMQGWYQKYEELLKKLLNQKSSKRYWMDTTTMQLSEIDNSVTNDTGEPHPPMDCIMVEVCGLTTEEEIK